MIWFAVPLALIVAWSLATVIVDTKKEGFSVSLSIIPIWVRPSLERIEDDLFLTVGNVQLCVHSPEIQYKLEQVEAEARLNIEDRLDRAYGDGYHSGWKDGYEHKRLESLALAGDELTGDEIDFLFSDRPTD